MITLTARHVESGDWWPLYAWRHDPATSDSSFSLPPTYEQHTAYMAACDRHTHMFEDPTLQPAYNVVGIARVRDTELDITVNPLTRRRGYGQRIVRWLQANYPALTAITVIGNMPALRMFIKCGFCITGVLEYKGKPCVLLEWRHSC